MEYLGHLIDATGIHPTRNKALAINHAPIPTNITQVRAIVGLMNYYGKFIPQAAARMAPLYKLLEKDQVRGWTEECDCLSKL